MVLFKFNWNIGNLKKLKTKTTAIRKKVFIRNTERKVLIQITKRVRLTNKMTSNHIYALEKRRICEFFNIFNKEFLKKKIQFSSEFSQENCYNFILCYLSFYQLHQ